MTTKEEMNSIQKNAKVAGVLYLLIAVLAGFVHFYVPGKLFVSGDAATTASNIMASQALFRMSISSELIILLSEIVLSVLLYVLLKPVNKTLSLMAAFSRLAMTVIQGINLLNYFFVLLLLSGAGYLTVFAPDQLDTLALLFLNAHADAILIWGLFFSLHLFLYGYLVYKSGYIPRLIGVLLIIASLSYLLQGFGNILFPQYKGVFTSIGFLSSIEIALPLWLLIKGVNVEQWQKRISESA